MVIVRGLLIRMLDQITPLILTYNEAPNIGRMLEQLRWARDIVVVDSFSEDDTLEIASRFPQVRVVQRKFDCLENQWNFGLKETGIASDWVLALDADYILTPALQDELRSLAPISSINGFRVSFQYCVYGLTLRGSAYPPVVVLYRPEHAHYRQDGHAHRVVINGSVESLRAFMLHDDRKSLSHWLRSQDLYQQLEREKLTASRPGKLSLPDRIRKLRFVSPFVVLFYCLIVKRGIFDGKAGLYYAFQRMLAETLLSLHLIDQDLNNGRPEQSLTPIENPRPASSEIQ
jgi:glycosyltransferase involved in cell wall biosynthesis